MHKLLLCAVASTLLGACAPTSRLLKPPVAATEPSPLERSQATDGMAVQLQRVIVRNDSASWVRDAEWDEYVLTVRNDAPSLLALRSIELSSDLLGSSQHAVSSGELKSQTAKNLDTMKAAGRVLLIGYAGIATGGVLAMSALGYGLVTPLLPLAVIVAGVSAYRSQSRTNADNAVIEHELVRRGFSLPARLASGTQLQGSAFFPVTPAPRRLLLRYDLDGTAREIAVDLGRFSTLHLAPANAQESTPPAQSAKPPSGN
ncbi:MAG: hypothetical protein ABIQ29_07785 [Burkholderiaceae bacterium]